MEHRSSAPASHRVIAYGQPIPKGGGSYKVGDPYQIDGQWHTPREDPGYDRTGIASYYAHDFHGRRTANGEIFDMSALSAAHPTLPLPSLVYVTNMENGRTLLLRVNDRGPYVNNRVIDVSRAAARYLGFEMRGTARVRVRYAGRAPLTGDDRNEQRFLASQSWFRVALSHAPYASR
jgi:rare lipoprotein A